MIYPNLTPFNMPPDRNDVSNDLPVLIPGGLAVALVNFMGDHPDRARAAYFKHELIKAIDEAKTLLPEDVENLKRLRFLQKVT